MILKYCSLSLSYILQHLRHVFYHHQAYMHLRRKRYYLLALSSWIIEESDMLCIFCTHLQPWYSRKQLVSDLMLRKGSHSNLNMPDLHKLLDHIPTSLFFQGIDIPTFCHKGKHPWFCHTYSAQCLLVLSSKLHQPSRFGLSNRILLSRSSHQS